MYVRARSVFFKACLSTDGEENTKKSALILKIRMLGLRVFLGV